jgi:hypothetical protein
MINKEDITLLIQGLYSNDVIMNKIDNYKSFFNHIIYSTWKDGNIKNNSDIEYVVDDLPDVSNKYNVSNIYYQCKSTLNGLEKVKTKYVLKHRTDEFFSNINILVNQFNNKLLCANIFFRRISDIPYQISDHFFLGETDRIRETFFNLEKYLSSSDEYQILNNKYGSEMLIALQYILTFGKYNIKYLTDNYHNKENVFNVMKEYFDVIDVNILKPLRVVHNNRGIVYDSFDDVRYNSIKKIDDLIL